MTHFHSKVEKADFINGTSSIRQTSSNIHKSLEGGTNDKTPLDHRFRFEFLKTDWFVLKCGIDIVSIDISRAIKMSNLIYQNALLSGLICEKTQQMITFLVEYE